MRNYKDTSGRIVSEVEAVLKQVDPREVETLVRELIAAEKVFLFAVGRVFLSLQCLGKRLGHMGIDCQAVGAVNEKPIGSRDLMLIASGSDANAGLSSIQPMSTLFDRCLHLFGDAVTLMIQDAKGLKKEELWRHHANLE